MKKLLESWRGYSKKILCEGLELGDEEQLLDDIFGAEIALPGGEEAQEPLTELGVAATIGLATLGGVIGVMALKGGALAYLNAKALWEMFGEARQEAAAREAAQMGEENKAFVIEVLGSDEELNSLLGELAELTEIVQTSKGKRSKDLAAVRKRLPEVSKAVTARIATVADRERGAMPHPKLSAPDIKRGEL